MLSHVAYITVLVALSLTLPSFYFDPSAAKFIFLVGAIAIWRYTWAAQHFVRGWYYTRRVFPRIRARAEALGADADPSHAFFLITSFRIGTETSVRVFREAVREAIGCGVPTTVVASIVEMNDERMMKQIFNAMEPPEWVDLKLVRIAGTGKRDGLAVGFRAISATPVDLENAVVAVIDGDTILTPGCMRACFPMFRLNPRLGALTTDEVCMLEGDDAVTRLYRRWYSMRFAQRTMYMASHALARRVLTLTGRMSMFRGSIVGDPAFIDRVEFDTIEHWRLGRFRFLTGDDKSTWFHVLKDGWEMGYVPDATVLTVEQPPHSNFLKGATMLMRRWFGNMLRTNARARQIDRGTMGTYTWWTLRDQLISMWTSLFGLFVAALGSLKAGGGLFMAFIVWILFTRYLISLALSVFHRNFSPTWPLLLYFNQIYGSLVKIYMLTHMHKQTWTRQKTTLKHRQNPIQRLITEGGSDLAWATGMLLFTTLVALYVGVFSAKEVEAFVQMMVATLP